MCVCFPGVGAGRVRAADRRLFQPMLLHRHSRHQLRRTEGLCSRCQPDHRRVVNYTIDGSTPTSSSAMYLAPLLISSNLTIKAIGTAAGFADRSIASWSLPAQLQARSCGRRSFRTGGRPASQMPRRGLQTGANGWGNSELEDYCGWNSTTSPCDPANPNSYVEADGYCTLWRSSHRRLSLPLPG